jgi:F-type H+-transporting ATPase subunit epsilon
LANTMALPETIHLEIVTPEKLVFSGTVDSLIVPATTGYMGILPGHSPLLAELGIGEISYKISGLADFLFCSWGFLEVLPDRVVVLAQTAEMASDIDLKRAGEARARAEKHLVSKDPNVDISRAQLALLRAVTRLDAAKHRSARR